MSTNQIELVLFDLGGVLVELGEVVFPSSWVSDEQIFGLKEWLSSKPAIEFETGRITSKEFIHELKLALSITVPDSQVYSAFSAWPQGLFPGAEELILRIQAQFRVAVLSNSNQIHEPILLTQFGLENLIDDIFFSHLIGHSKPSLGAFEYVLRTLKLRPSQVMFFDDNADNIAAAKGLGMCAHQVFCPSGVAGYVDAILA